MKILLNIVLVSLMAGCAAKPVDPPAGFYLKYSLDEPAKLGSWDQENLKAHDHGCPTTIFSAPGGELQQCD